MELELRVQPSHETLYSLLFGPLRVRCSVWKHYFSMLFGLLRVCWPIYTITLAPYSPSKLQVSSTWPRLSIYWWFSPPLQVSCHLAVAVLIGRFLVSVEAVVTAVRCGDMDLRIQPPNKLCIAPHSLPSTHTSRALIFSVSPPLLSVALLFSVQ